MKLASFCIIVLDGGGLSLVCPLSLVGGGEGMVGSFWIIVFVIGGWLFEVGGLGFVVGSLASFCTFWI